MDEWVVNVELKENLKPVQVNVFFRLQQCDVEIEVEVNTDLTVYLQSQMKQNKIEIKTTLKILQKYGKIQLMDIPSESRNIYQSKHEF